MTMVLLKLGLPAEKCIVQNVVKRCFCQYNRPKIPAGKSLAVVTSPSKTFSIEKQIRNRYLTMTSSLFGVNVRPHQIPSRLAAEQLVRDMSEDERKRVFNVLQDLKQELLLEQGLREPTPNMNQLFLRKLKKKCFWFIFDISRRTIIGSLILTDRDCPKRF